MKLSTRQKARIGFAFQLITCLGELGAFATARRLRTTHENADCAAEFSSASPGQLLLVTKRHDVFAQAAMGTWVFGIDVAVAQDGLHIAAKALSTNKRVKGFDLLLSWAGEDWWAATVPDAVATVSYPFERYEAEALAAQEYAQLPVEIDGESMRIAMLHRPAAGEWRAVGVSEYESAKGGE